MPPEGMAQIGLAADAEWDAADMGCGPLVLELRKRLRAMPGRVLKVAARDPGAALDLPAWCRLTANDLLHHDADNRCFWIRSRTVWS
jgi:tRNA 2-thiouridine synthesizing protein A